MSINASVTGGGSLAIYVGFGVGLAALGVVIAGYWLLRRATRLREQNTPPTTNHPIDPTLSPYGRSPSLEAAAQEVDLRPRLKMDLTMDKERRDSLHPYTIRPSRSSHGGNVSPPHPKAICARRGDSAGVGGDNSVGGGNGSVGTHSHRRSLAPETDVAELAQLGAEARRAGFSVPALVQSLRLIDHNHDVEEAGSRRGPPVYSGLE
ncbi:hypothetical protein EXIGLDRAFT_775091 [Exidia glandulosa HHB12029]|uniref:Uncharacterized protein n=1 Tax=Exidia glandulosa HHB12029 TaxID=1314781 RepID=A0A165E240_EXIGL|nr:hypothetical protein EXIGLDRAFT_775091 [Exidia glandulosa HHB12029]